MSYERLASTEMRSKKAKEIYDKYIYVELLVMNTEVCKGHTPCRLALYLIRNPVLASPSRTQPQGLHLAIAGPRQRDVPLRAANWC